MYSCRKAVIYGSCGTLDRPIPENALIVPTHAYRDEGVSYHYREPSDYIAMPGSERVCRLLDEWQIPHVKGRTWTTDGFYRETEEEIRLRKAEGCIAVEMELSACQAIADYAGIDLYAFLYRADNVDSEQWEKGQRDSQLAKDARLKTFRVAFELAKRIAKE